MKFKQNYKEVIAVKECSAGNETVGTMWIETKTFHKDTPVSEIIAWAESSSKCNGKLIITVNENN
jgi:hypothetical protein